MIEKFYSEDAVDRWCAENLTLPPTGRWVDVGCAHPIQYSNTAFLRARGWHGIAIDGTPEYAPEWENVQTAVFINAVVANQERVRFINEKHNALVSRIHSEGQEVSAVPLSLIIGRDQVDFMSVDIEGAEYDVLSTYLAECIPPKVLVVEFNSAHLGRDPRIFNLCIGEGMKLVHITSPNAVFIS